MPLLVIDRRRQERRAGAGAGHRGDHRQRRRSGGDPAANLPAARCLLVAIPDAFEGGRWSQQGAQLNPALTIVARAHSDAEVEHLTKHGATEVVMAEHEIAKAMIADIPPEPPSSHDVDRAACAARGILQRSIAICRCRSASRCQ